MASTDTLDSSATAECPQSDRLKHYLSGWLNESDSEQLELHLQQCDTCESALRTLETQQDTLLQSLQATVAQSLSPAAAAGAAAYASAATARTSEPLASNDARPKPAASSDANASLVPTAATPLATSCNAPELDAAMSKVRRLFDAPAEQESQAFIRSWHPAQRDFGIYELIRPLGRGGMGAVYLAKHRQLGRHVAIKLLPMMSAEDDDVRTRFDREIRVVGRLSHPSIVAATDAGEIDGTQYLVMEYVAGMDLSRLSRLMGRLPVADACELIRQAALGLSCAHAEGVVHRDIKPSNMMLDELGHIRILDFGLAQWTVWDEASVDLTTVGQLMGTLDYMAPEQAEASSGVDYRADLYALGATLFRLLCGRAPLAAAPNQSPLEKLRLLANHQPPRLSTLCPEAPEELVKLVASLLSRSASDRPASAAHVAEQLAPFAEGSKLVELLQQAREKAAATPEPARKSANPDRAVFTESAPVSIAPQPETTGKGGSRILRRLLLAASLPLMILAGILIKLELSKGQLIIESDVDNVNVKLLKDGKPVDGIQVTHGTTSTRLHADTYEITIDGPSDGLIIDHDKFTLKNGETVIARIQHAPRVAKEAEPAETRMPGGTVFDGEPLEYWLTVIENERSIERLRSAFGACSVLLTEDTASLITEKVLTALPEISPAKLKLSATSDEIRQLDSLAFRLVSLANPGEKWITVMVRELNKHDDSWQTRVVNYLWLNSEADRLSDNNLLPLVEWARIQLVAETATGPVGRERAAEVLLRIIQREEESGDLSSKCVQILDAEKTLPLSWWFAKPLRYTEGQNRGGREECWPNSLHSSVITRALNALNDSKLQGQELGHALVILKQAETLSPEQKVVLLKCVKHQLVERSTSVERLTEFVPVSPYFTLLCIPEVGISFHIGLPRPPGLCLTSFELLNLLQQLDPQSGDVAPIQAVRNALPKVEPLFEVRPPSFFSSNRAERRPTIAWPELKMSTGKVADRTQLATILISEHPLLNAQARTESEQTLPAQVNTKNDDPELEKRLTQLRLTNDEKEFMAILGALKSAKGDAAVRVAKTILEALPTLPVKEKTLRAPVEEFDFEVDERALELVAEVCPTLFFRLWCDSYDHALSDAWRLRLIAHVFEGLPPRNHSDNKSDIQAFHVWLAQYCKASDPKSDKKKLLHHLGTRLFWADPDPSFQLPVINALDESPYVENDWWLAPLIWNPDDSPIDKKRLVAAIDAIKDPECTHQSLTAAAFVIANPGRPRFKLSDAEQSEVHSAIIRQIRRLLDEPQDAIWKRVELDNRFYGFPNKAIASDELNLRITFSPLTRKVPISELLGAYLVTQSDASNAPELRLLADRILPVQSKIRLRGDSIALWLLTTEIDLSTLEAIPRILPPLDESKPKRTPQECSDQLWGAGSKPTEADWIQFCLLYHKALTPYRKEFEAAQGKSTSQATQTALPVHNGKTLEEWIATLETTTYEESVLQAIQIVKPILESKDPSQISTFQTWFARYVTEPKDASSKRAELVPLVATKVFAIESDAQFQEPLIKALDASPYIKEDWWLHTLQHDPKLSPVDNRRLSLAIKKLEDIQTPEQQLAAAACIVTSAETQGYLGNDSEKAHVGQLVIRQLRKALDSTDEILLHGIELDGSIGPGAINSQVRQMQGLSNKCRTTVVEELLDAVLTLNQTEIAANDLRRLAERILPIHRKIQLKGDSLSLWRETRFVDRGHINAKPSASLDAFNDPTTLLPTPQECSDQLWGAGSKPTEADWIQFCLSYHKALAPYRKEFEAAQARTKTEPPMPSPAEPLYNGQSLEHWLEMLSRERSVDGLKAAFEACAALLTPQNSETVTETLYKVLPGLDGNLKVTDKEQNRVWTLDYEAATILRKANPGSKFFVRWVTARTASTNAEWNKRLLTYISYSGPESFDDLKPVVSWAGSVLSQDVSSNTDAVAIADVAVLLRGFLNYESVRDYAELAKTSTDILINCPQLNEDWWISQPIQYRSSNGNKELGTPIFRDKVVSVAIRVLEREDSSPSQVAQACMILANGATLNDEQKRSVLTVIQRRLEQLAKDKEALIDTTTVPESFSDFAAPIIASNSPLPVSQIMITTPSSMTRSIPVTSTSLVVQLLNVVFTIDDGKTTEPQRQLLFEATRGVFDIVMSARPKAQDEQESAVSRGFRIPPNAIPGLLWPDLELTDGAGPFGPRYPQLAQRVTKELWRDHAPTKSDWMHFIILTHPAMKDVVNRAIEDRKNVAQSPGLVPKSSPLETAAAATVRIRVTGRSAEDSTPIENVGTGTIVYSERGETVILTCAHFFLKMAEQGRKIQVEIFESGMPTKLLAEIIGNDVSSDLAFLRIRTAKTFPCVVLTASMPELKTGQSLVSFGCDDGGDPSRLTTTLLAVNKYSGPGNLSCSVDPNRGRCGGGLFREDGVLIGVCNAADRESHEGLYMSIEPIQTLVQHLNLQYVCPRSEVPSNGEGTTSSAEVPKP